MGPEKHDQQRLTAQEWHGGSSLRAVSAEVWTLVKFFMAERGRLGGGRVAYHGDGVQRVLCGGASTSVIESPEVQVV